MAAIQNRKQFMKKHGLTKHPLYHVWGSMKRRCYNKKDRAYKWYGAKGIGICDEWLNDFKCFYNWAISNGWAKGLSIDREKNELGYSPENCRFITMAKQQANRTYNYHIEYNGQIKTLADWCKELNLSYSLMNNRMWRGLDFKTAMETKKYDFYNL